MREPRVHRVGAGVLAALMILGAAAAGCATTDAPADASDPPGDAPADASDPPGDAPADASLEPNATVERVVDGDTIIVDISGQRERVRLIGIDTPESVDENRPVQCYGHEASAFVADLLPPGTPVTLILDAETRDQYGRLLAYVVRSSDQLFVNLTLLELGYADTLTIEPNDHYAQRFERAAADARAAGRGLWGACGGPDVPLG